ncbi:MAG: hypothetical protein U5K74_01130 [Gemmatimonadaceae bacterium]|nr:hypothetical protein [Gemmatimonadaceae bacterium]
MRASALGVDVVDRISYDPGSSNRSEVALIVRLWKERHIDGVFLAAEAGPAARFARELASQQMAVTLLGGGICPCKFEEFIAEGGDRGQWAGAASAVSRR